MHHVRLYAIQQHCLRLLICLYCSFYSAPPCSGLPRSAPVCSVLFSSALCSVLLCSVLFLFCSVLLYSDPPTLSPCPLLLFAFIPIILRRVRILSDDSNFPNSVSFSLFLSPPTTHASNTHTNTTRPCRDRRSFLTINPLARFLKFYLHYCFTSTQHKRINAFTNFHHLRHYYNYCHNYYFFFCCSSVIVSITLVSSISSVSILSFSTRLFVSLSLCQSFSFLRATHDHNHNHNHTTLPRRSLFFQTF